MTKLKNLYFTFIHLFLLVVLLKSDFIDKAMYKINIKNPPEITSHFKNMVTYHRYMNKSTPNGSVVLIGDSITQGLNTAAINLKAVNFGIGSDTTVGVIERLPYYSESIESAKYIILAVGVNDLKRRSNSEIVANYEKIINQLPNDKEIIISSILPVGIEKEKIHDLQWNNRITAVNSGLKLLSQKHKNVRYLDVNSKLSDTNGLLPTNFHVGDGVHLSSDAYKIWIDQINKLAS